MVDGAGAFSRYRWGDRPVVRKRVDGAAQARSACCTTASQPLAVAVGARHHDGYFAAGGATTVPTVTGHAAFTRIT